MLISNITGLIKGIGAWISKPLGLLIAAALLLTMVIFTINSGWSALFRTLNGVSFGTEARVFDTRTIVGGVKPLGQLTTVSYQRASADTHVRIYRGTLNLCQQSASFAYIVEVQAGIDLTTLDSDAIQYDEETETYTLTVPQPALTSCNVYENYSRYEMNMPTTFSTCVRHHDNEFAMLGEIQAIYATRQQVVAEGILEEARDQTEETLQTFLTALTDKTVVIEYADVETADDRSCTPDIPQGWSAEDNTESQLIWIPAN